MNTRKASNGFTVSCQGWECLVAQEIAPCTALCSILNLAVSPEVWFGFLFGDRVTAYSRMASNLKFSCPSLSGGIRGDCYHACILLNLGDKKIKWRPRQQACQQAVKKVPELQKSPVDGQLMTSLCSFGVLSLQLRLVLVQSSSTVGHEPFGGCISDSLHHIFTL